MGDRRDAWWQGAEAMPPEPPGPGPWEQVATPYGWEWRSADQLVPVSKMEAMPPLTLPDSAVLVVGDGSRIGRVRLTDLDDFINGRKPLPCDRPYALPDGSLSASPVGSIGITGPSGRPGPVGIAPKASSRAVRDVPVHAAVAAVRTLERQGYTYHDGVEWKPPLGPALDFARLDADARRREAERRVVEAAWAFSGSDDRGFAERLAGLRDALAALDGETLR